MPRTISKTEVRQNVANPNMSYGDPDHSTETPKEETAAPEFKLAWESRDRDRDGNYWSFACDSLGLLITPNRTLQALNFDGKNPGGRPRHDSEWLLLAFGKVIKRGDLSDLKKNALQYLREPNP